MNEELEPEVVIRKLKVELKRVRDEVKFLKGENGEGDGGLTKEEYEELVDCAHRYMSAGETAELNIGNITLTKLQALHKIFKDLVKKKGEENDGGYSMAEMNAIKIKNESNDGDNLKVLRNQIRSLQTTVQQRENEIKELVDVVKKGGGDTSAYENRDVRIIAKDVDTASGNNLPILKADSSRSRLVKVCGVEMCLDQEVLQDPSRAFDFFKQRYPGKQSISENKLLLQARFQEAKDEGEIVKNCKEQINIQRNRIEKIRRNIAMEQVTGTSSTRTETDVTSPDESRCLSIIEENKKLYKAGLQHLRELKGTIEHIKKLMEKNQRKVQTDFDTWYAKMYEFLESRPENVEQVGVDNVNIKDVKNGHQSQKMETLVPSAVGPLRKETETPSISGTDSSSKSTFRLPPGIRLTGNKEADDDIVAFYKAKEALMARTKARSSARPPPGTK